MVLVKTQPKLHGKRVVGVGVFAHEHRGCGHAKGRRRVAIALGEDLFVAWIVLHSGHHFWLHESALGDDALAQNKLAQQTAVESSRSHGIASESTVESEKRRLDEWLLLKQKDF